MKLRDINCNSYSFGSKNCPIKPFKINTNNGVLFAKEISKKDLLDSGAFSFECALESLPFMQIQRDILSKDTFLIGNLYANFHKQTLAKKDGNSTILIAKDSNHKIKALFTIESFDEFARKENGFSDVRTGYIGECMIAPEFRRQGIGKILLDKILQTSKGYFSDIFLESSNESVGFYNKAGFEVLNTSISAIRKINNYILTNRSDRDYITLMSKSLDPKNPWWQRIVKNLD